MALFLKRSTNLIKHLTTTNHSSFLRISHNNVCNKTSFLGPLSSVFVRLESTKAAELKLDSLFYSSEDDEHDHPSSEGMDFPGGKVMFTSQMSFIAESGKKRVPCYRVLDDCGEPISGKIHELYREPGVLLWRGFTLQEFTNQCFGNKADYGKGRQMPIHYGSNKHNYFTISSPIATQLPQAAGAAYSLKIDNKDACVVAYMGDGCTSEGDFHAGLNFAAVMEVPIVFICRNNGYAISTPITDQFRSDGVVVKGQAYGIRSIRVDGNDALAVYNVVQAAREMAISEQRPILVEALTYRVGHHSTSDDSTKYRPAEEIEHWKMAKSPVTKFQKWVERNGWWNEEDELEIRDRIKKEIIQSIQVAEKLEKPPISELFTDVYDQPTKDLIEQEILLRETINKHPKDYPSDVAV
ncbi:2-oxoisovalerate dehydrogenase subunit alpha 2, mitochondrial isoform X2 [Beta vulgaris subsp. vulgaris]|uniref:2-oxoisovalerate dehydrogenase subunit alpha 2, mitochondrial isoform X2 n=1 Tax=Beta vulgaris subsp. vulgaris TaxID=3555 RepID=UPI002037512E|nr:2-oxoisovalerate dehydrogenase subunit alpha 2, mitochondrial isoform X2 [Beta vulgaris subsp. vulgaris]